MGSDTIWIIGSNMTRFGKHPDKDVVDLAAKLAVRHSRMPVFPSQKSECWESGTL
ncbi:MAG: hypothetical protein CM15mP49_01670 [Actinomycetota bacterium]|nr:MAG: hypothetical protein CM15mP49_01670 [Actinomycetota bacterium]